MTESSLHHQPLSATDADLAQLEFFPRLRFGMPRHGFVYLRPFIVSCWHLAISARTYIEDAEGAADLPGYLVSLKVGLSELLVAVDCLLQGIEPLDDHHRLAMLFEHGLSEVVVADPERCLSALGLDHPDGDGEPEIARLVALWDAIQEAFPAELPNPLVPGGQGELLRALRSWDRLLRSAEVDSGFLADLYRTL